VGVSTLNQADFVRRFAMRSTQVAWLLGAGASAAAGVPTAGHMISGFKADLFASENKIARREIDVDDPLWALRIRRHFDNANGFPPADDPSEYQVAFERMYPDARDRRTYIDQQVGLGSPSFGHRVMAALLASGRLPLVFTTNFDTLIERAAIAMDELLEPADRASLAVSGLTNTDIAERCLREGDWPLLVKLHGDYQSIALKNTDDELQTQDGVLRHVLTEATRRFGVAVVGYSGRDSSVMRILAEGLEAEDPYPGGLYWIARPGATILPAVEDLLVQARLRSVEAWVVESETFDELFGEIDRQMTFSPRIGDALVEFRPAVDVVDVDLPTVESARFPALRCNALALTSWPTVARSVRLTTTLTADSLRDALRSIKAHADAVSNGTEILAFGRDADLKAALDPPDWKPEVRSIEIAKDAVGFGLTYAALTRAMARSRPLRPILRRSGHVLALVDPATTRDEDRRRRLEGQLTTLRQVYGDDLYGTVRGTDRAYAEGISLAVERRLDRWWLLFEPMTWVQPSRDRTKPDPVAPWLRERWVRRRNKEWASMVDAWAQLLAPHDDTEVRAWWLPDDAAGVDATFVLGKVTAWSPPGRGVTS
jgi:NAD-dependent SIR2 family protein deacetylase